MRRSALLACIVSVLLVLGCTPKHSFKEVALAPEAGALLYVYRPYSPPVLRTPEIRANGVRLGDLSQWRYMAVPLRPGRYTIDVDWSWDTLIADSKVDLRVEAGQKYYLRVVSGMTGVYAVGGIAGATFSGSAAEIDREMALPELKKCGAQEDYQPHAVEVVPK